MHYNILPSILQSIHWLGYRLQVCSITVKFPAVSRDLSALLNNQTSSGTHTGPSSTGTKGSYSGGKAARMWSQLLTWSSQISVMNAWSCNFIECNRKTFITNTTRPELTYTLASFHDLIFIKNAFQKVALYHELFALKTTQWKKSKVWSTH
jgi:hypothetical protein